jgi:large subunit ribosomal protein L25
MHAVYPCIREGLSTIIINFNFLLMKAITVKAEKRPTLGKKEARKLRALELVPGVLYGKDEVIHLTIPFSELRKLVYTPNVYLVDLDIDGDVSRAMIQDVQWHPVDEQILHIDFLKVEDNKPVKISAPVKITGLARGIKAGGKLKINMRKLKVKALAENLPDVIEIDVTRLGIGNSIKVGELKRENLEFLDNKSNLIVGVVSTRVAQKSMALPEEEEEGGEESSAEQSESLEQ